MHFERHNFILFSRKKFVLKFSDLLPQKHLSFYLGSLTVKIQMSFCSTASSCHLKFQNVQLTKAQLEDVCSMDILTVTVMRINKPIHVWYHLKLFTAI